MNPIPLSEIRRATGAAELPSIPGDPAIAAVCTDTRALTPGSLFIALRGENFDGHDFLAKAAATCAAALVDRPIPNPPPGLRLLTVPDTRAAMGRLARYVRQKFRGKVIAVAGSNGKTGTKNLIHSALRHHRRGSISPKSFNNDVGVPLAIFPADPTDDYLVLELGTNRPGEIRTLANIAMPDIAVITNCSAEHLEGLGDLDGVRRENATIIESLRPQGILITSGDDPALLRAIAPFHGPRTRFGFGKSNDIWATNVHCNWSGTRFSVHPGKLEVTLPLIGAHNAANALSAVAIARLLGLTDEQIVQSLATAVGPDMRLQPIDAKGIRILNDAYNANPASMKSAIETLASIPTAGRRIAILGDMRELGDASPHCHREIANIIAKQFPPDLLICVGPESREIVTEATKLGFPAARIEHYPDAAAATAITARLGIGDLVLLKASRAIGLEAVARAIVASRNSSVATPLAAAS